MKNWLPQALVMVLWLGLIAGALIRSRRLSPQQREARWERIHRAGLLRFVLVYGVLGWGVMTAAAYSCIDSLVISRSQTFLELLARSLMIFPAFGIVWGLMMWNLGTSRTARRRASPPK